MAITTGRKHRPAPTVGMRRILTSLTRPTAAKSASNAVHNLKYMRLRLYQEPSAIFLLVIRSPIAPLLLAHWPSEVYPESTWKAIGLELWLILSINYGLPWGRVAYCIGPVGFLMLVQLALLVWSSWLCFGPISFVILLQLALYYCIEDSKRTLDWNSHDKHIAQPHSGLKVP